MINKKMLCTILLVSLLLSLPISYAYVIEDDCSRTDPIVAEQQFKRDINTNEIEPFGGIIEATEEEMEYWRNREKELTEQQMLNLLDENRENIKLRGRWYTLRPFTYIGQEESNTCGPACVRMALEYILDDANYTEEEIADGCNTTASGTTLENMASYINGEQSNNSYYVRYNANQTTMQNNLYSGVVAYDAPPIIGVRETTIGGWPYNLLGHAVIIHGAYSDKSEFAICDPWAGFCGDDDHRWYDLSSDVLFEGYDAINAGYMY